MTRRPRRPGGLRTRLAVTLVALVALTVAGIGLGVYAFVDASLRGSMVAEARRQADFNLSVLLPAEDPRPTTAGEFAASGLPAAFRFRGDVETIADFGGGGVYESDPRLAGALGDIDPGLRSIVAGGQIGFAWQELRGERVLVGGVARADRRTSTSCSTRRPWTTPSCNCGSASSGAARSRSCSRSARPGSSRAGSCGRWPPPG
ncbi:MAG: hypothetical protein U0838_15885 [Chloroflexota bacterium]